MKKIIIIILILIAGISFFLLKENKTLTLEEQLSACSGIENKYGRDDCYYNIVKDNPDLSICDQMKDLLQRSFCYSIVA
jgi:hypothetical protein